MKYETRTQFRNGSCSAYTAALKKGWMEQICGHMTLRWEKKWASKEKCQEEAKKYSTPSAFAKGTPSAYTYAMRHGFLAEICQHMQRLWVRMWDKDTCTQAAMKYKRRIDFQRNDNSAYTYAMRHGFLDEICQHMDFYVEAHDSGSRQKHADFVRSKLIVPDEEWEELLGVFLDKDYATYASSRISLKRCIYAAEFSDHSVYVGLTNNLKARIRQHVNSHKSQVFRHIALTGLMPVFKIVKQFEGEKTAQKSEGEVLREYKNKGWTILNRAKTGALGGSVTYWTKERCMEVARKSPTRSYFIMAFSGAYASCVKNLWIDEANALIRKSTFDSWTTQRLSDEAGKYNSLSEFRTGAFLAYEIARKRNVLYDICKHMNPRRWDSEALTVEARKYHTRKEFRKNSPAAYSTAQKTGIIDSICKHMAPPRIRKWSVEMLRDEASKYSTVKEFRKGNSGAYSTALKMGVMDSICSHMTRLSKNTGQGNIYWTRERCAEEALKYKTRVEFKKNSGSAYTTAVREGWLDELCAHMVHPKPGIVKWSKEACAAEAAKYKRKIEFKKNSHSAYVTAVRNKWMQDICTHMKK